MICESKTRNNLRQKTGISSPQMSGLQTPIITCILADKTAILARILPQALAVMRIWSKKNTACKIKGRNTAQPHHEILLIISKITCSEWKVVCGIYRRKKLLGILTSRLRRLRKHRPSHAQQHQPLQVSDLRARGACIPGPVARMEAMSIRSRDAILAVS